MHADHPPSIDVTALAAVLDGTTAGVAVFDTELRYLYVNPSLVRRNGLPPAAHIGRRPSEVLPDIDAREDLMRAVLADGRAREVTSSGRLPAESGTARVYWHGAYHRLEADGRVLGVVGIVLEVMADDEQRRFAQAQRHLSLLDSANTRIGTTLDMDTTCAELADLVVPGLADIAAVEVFPPDVAPPVRPAPPDVVRLRRAAMSAVRGLSGGVTRFGVAGDYIDYQEEAAVSRCLATNQPVVEDLTDTERLRRSAPHPDRAAAYRELGLHSSVAVPISVRGAPIGVLGLLRAGGSPVFSDDDVVVARELAGRAAVHLDHARRFTHEHTIALELQRSLLSEPRPPHPHIEVATRYLPADRSVLVGGDWFDVIPLPDGRHLKAMGDVMGHGVEAAVAMSHYRSLLRLLADEELPPHRILEQLDRMVERSGIDRAATCLLTVVNADGGLCEVASAGHLPPVFLDPGPAGTRICDVPAAPPLGTGFGGYRSTVMECGPGTVLFMYTDGLVERRGEDIDASVARLGALTLPDNGDLETFLDRVLERFGPGAEDDIAVMASRTRDEPDDPAPEP
ncbi:SpoIIE family protein phosphatase [Streptomyces drozdowiczii]|uniref:SpoIIE family protein phosphatase n=1 Tax=Streptomyces drozdowiczii TaxID=202862 RepID=A0ABY6Q275_9ACTN|nr:SpoIIE family protein phosphatase [Streptomyces drozdowiczii]MCX0244752.1 SpoIIE family protein phosphatase [Streptomyces drozdowiczii]UZK58527.1 SpoIIE family protein phosphatase [Streptomyces drozdowiczii]